MRRDLPHQILNTKPKYSKWCGIWQVYIQTFSRQTCGRGSRGEKKINDWKCLQNTWTSQEPSPVQEAKHLASLLLKKTRSHFSEKTKVVLNSGRWIRERTGARQRVTVGEFGESLLYIVQQRHSAFSCSVSRMQVAKYTLTPFDRILKWETG